MFQQLDVIGRIANEVELRYSSSNKAILRLAVIVNNGENDKTCFNFVCFGNYAENHSKYLSKGDLIRVLGTMKNRVEEQEGHKNYTYNLYANQILYLVTKKSRQSKTTGEEVIEQVVNNMTKQEESDPFKDFNIENSEELNDLELPF